MVVDRERLNVTPLHDLHVELGARMAEFAGYDMPIQYPMGILAEHQWTRAHAGLFDVSHMGPGVVALPELADPDPEKRVPAPDAHDRIAAVFEPLVCADLRSLKPGEQKLTLLLAEDGGILDDLMVSRPAEPHLQGMLNFVVNAGRKDRDFRHIEKAIGGRVIVRGQSDHALIALQGPEAEDVLAEIAPDVTSMSFLQVKRVTIAGGTCLVSRSGYTGEDGFEIMIPNSVVAAFARRLLADPRVKPIGLGARDSLRLEAGMCLYGHDIDTTKTPVEASLAWTISKSRRERADFPGAARILDQLKNGVASKRVGLRPLGRAPAREGAEIQTPDGAAIGVVTSGGFGPTVNGPVAMGYVDAQHAKPGTKLHLIVRGKPIEAEVAALPFVPHKYKR